MSTPPWLAAPPAADSGTDILVVGAGIAGAAAARALVEQGCTVRVMDSHTPASAASGNPAAVLRPVLARDPRDPLSRFYSDAFNTARAGIHTLRAQGHTIAGAFEGVLHCHPHPQELRGSARHQCWDRQQAQAELGTGAAAGGVWFPEGGWVSPVDYCKALLQHEHISLIQAELSTLEHDGWGWRLRGVDGSLIGSAESVVLATGWQLSQLAPTSPLPINPVASQLLHFREQGPSNTPSGVAGRGPRVPVVGGGTLCPTPEGWLATAGHWHDTTESRVDASRNGEILQRCAGLWSMPPHAEEATPRAAVRATSRDYLPMVGGVPDFEQARAVYEDLAHGRPMHHYPNAPHLPGLYLLGALGGRGITSAQLCAEVLTAVILGKNHPWQSALHPLRFLARQLKRGAANG